MRFSFFALGGVGPWVRFLHFSRFIDRYVAALAAPRILDAGCGTGSHLAWLSHRLPGAHLVGVDSSAGPTYAGNATSATKALRGCSVEFRVADLKTLDADGEFDVVYSIDVLEHIPDNAAVMRRLFAALRPGGLLYLAMPYDRERHTLLPRALLRNFQSWADEEHIGEMRPLDETCDLLRQIGFTVIEARYTFGPPARAAWELQQWLRSLPAGRFLDPLARPILNAVAATDRAGSGPDDGNLAIVCRKP